MLVGDVHQDLGALSCLGIFIGHIGHAFIMADITKMLPYRRRDGDGAQRNAQPFAQDFGVGAGADGGAEARHGDGDHIGAGAPQQVQRADGHQQRQGGIQPAGNAQYRLGAADVLQTAAQPLGLHGQNGFAALPTLGVVGGDKGVRVDKAGQGRFAHRQRKRNHGIAGRFGRRPRGGAAAFGKKSVNVKLGEDEVIGEQGGFRQQFAVFGDEIMPGKGHIGGGLSPAGIGIKVARHQPGALPGNKGTAVFRLADGFIAGGAVGDNGGPGDGMADAGGRRHPQILAELHCQFIFRQLPAAEQQAGPERYLLPQQRNGFYLGGGGGEPAFLVEFAVVRQVQLRHDAEELPPVQHGGAVIQLALHRQRQPGHGGKGKRAAFLQ